MNNTDSTGNASLSMVVIPKSVWEGLAKDVQEVKSILTKKAEDAVNSQYIESSEVKRILGVSQKTWQNYRDERRLPFVQFGRKIFVKRVDLESFMESHKICCTNG